MVELTYHQETYAVLNRQPNISGRALALIAEAEERCGITLPPSVREWYSLDGAVEILAIHSNDDHPVPLEELGQVEEDWPGSDARDFVAEGYLLVMVENQGVCNWAVELDGSADPPVVVEVDSSPDTGWRLCADTFSTFVYTQVWDWQRLGRPAVSAQDRSLSLEDIEFLRGRYTEGPVTYGWPGKENYRFSQHDQRVLIWSSKDQADWFLWADTTESLVGLIKSVWQLGGLSVTLYGIDAVGESALQRVRGLRYRETGG